MREFFDLASNPMFVKHIRSRLRKSSLLPGVVIIAFLSLCIVFINDFVIKDAMRNPDPDSGSQMFFFLQGFILVLMGGSQVASSIAQMKESGIIDFHRITPIPPKVQAVGILLGAPIRELILYSITLPFALYLAISGPVGITDFSKLLLVQIGGAIMYYTLAMITGLTTSKARGASGRFVAILALLNIAAPMFFTFGVYGPTLITATPVYMEVFYGEEQAAARKRNQQKRVQKQQQQGGFNPNPPPQQVGGAKKQPNQPVPQNQPVPADDDDVDRIKITFYGLNVPIVLQSLMFQFGVLTFLFIAASRRIHSARLPLYHKPTALMFLATMSFLTLGSLWDANTLPLTLGGVYFLSVFAVLLTNTITPALGDIVKGMQRAFKISESRVPIWSDLSSNKFLLMTLAVTIAVTMAIGIVHSDPNARLGGLIDFTPWPSLLVGVLTILSYGFASQYIAIAYGNRARGYFVLFLFFAWFVPIIIGMIIMAQEREVGGYVLTMSPIIGITLAGTGLPRVDQDVLQVLSIAPVAALSLIFMVLLFREERKLRDEIIDEHERREHKRRKRAAKEEEEYEQERPRRDDDERPRP